MKNELTKTQATVKQTIRFFNQAIKSKEEEIEGLQEKIALARAQITYFKNQKIVEEAKLRKEYLI